MRFFRSAILPADDRQNASEARRAARGRGRTLMLSTSSPGGIKSLVEAYKSDGVFEQWNVEWIVTHVDGTVFGRATVFLKSIVRVVCAFRSGNVTLVHCHCASRGSFFRKAMVASLARAFGVPVILHLHGGGMKDFYRSISFFGRRFVGRQLRKASVVVVLSESWRQFALSIAPGCNVVVLPNYASPPKAGFARRSGPVVRILFLGQIGEKKGVYDLLAAFELALQEVPNLRLILAGHGEIERAKAMAAELCIGGKVEFPGWVCGQEKERLLASSDIFVLPSHAEGLPMSILEAMSRQLAIIATRVGGIPDVVRDEVEALLVAPRAVRELAASIVRLGGDASARNAIAAAGRSRFDDLFSSEVVLPKLHGLYSDLAERRAARERERQQARGRLSA